jgi:hypothetical protein
MPILPSALIRQTAPLDDQAEAIEAEVIDQAEGQGRGQDSRPATRTTRRRKPATTATTTSKRGLYLTDATWEKLQLEAIRKRTSVSAVAGELLERKLPRLRIERDA